MPICLLTLALVGVQVPFHLEDLDLSEMNQGYGTPAKNRTVDGNPLRLGAATFERGIGTHAESTWSLRLDGKAVRFSSIVGVDAEAPQGTVRFLVQANGKTVADSGVMTAKDAPKTLSVPLAGVKSLRLVVEDGGDGINYDHADWAEPTVFIEQGGKPPVPLVIPTEPPMKIASHRRPQTEIHGPRIIGATPGHDVIFKVPATGKGKLTYRAEGLPSGLSMDSRGVISGRIKEAGTTPVKIIVSGPGGTDRRTLTFVAGKDKLALTPPMGWNSWNVWAGNIDADKVRAAADSFVSTGLADYGYSYINIDDCWEAGRDANGRILTNAKFPDMRALSDYVHNQGLKIGIYSSPGPLTCAGFTGSYQHEKLDAEQYADWGIDYLKYDWCSYGSIAKDGGLYELQKPYLMMRDALKSVDRDIIYSLCQYGMGDVHQWGKKVGGQLWRTTGDITDTWNSMSSIGFSHSTRSLFAGPGGWNDPDMLVVGSVGWGNPHPTKLKPNEQITHITLWAMLAAPLIIGCDMTKLDDFTKDLLMNHEVIEIDQDPLGKAATQVRKDGDKEVWARRLSDGGIAVALFNRGTERGKVSASRRDIGVFDSGERIVRDAWLRRQVGGLGATISATVPAHGAKLFTIWPKPAARPSAGQNDAAKMGGVWKSLRPGITRPPVPRSKHV